MPDEPQEHRHLPARYPQYPEPQHPAPQHDVFGYPGEDEDTIHLRDYWRVLVVRRWTILAVLLTVVTITAIQTYKQVPIFQATTRIQIDRENPNILAFQDVYEIESTTDDALQTQFEILGARSLARLVIEDLRLTEHPEFQPGEPSLRSTLISSVTNIFSTEADITPPPPGEDAKLRGTINAYLGRLTVSPVRLSRLVDVSFQSPDPDFAVRVINAHANHYREQNFQFKTDATQLASEFLSDTVEGMQFDLEAAETRLQEYSVANDILFTGDGLNTAMAKLQQLETEYLQAQADRIQKESYNRLIESGGENVLPQLMTNLLITDLSSSLANLQREEAELAVTFKPAHPRRQRIRSQIEENERSINGERQRIVSTLRSEYEASVQTEESFRKTVESQLDIVNQINAELIQYGILRRQADSNQQLYDGLLMRLSEAQVSTGLRATNIRIVDRAELPSSPVRPRKALNLALGLMGGLTFGVGLAFFQEYMDNTVKSPDDVARYLHVPTIAAVPRRDALKGKSSYGHYGLQNKPSGNGSNSIQPSSSPIELISFDSPNSVMAEAYRSMRTSLLLSSADHPPQTVMVTSALPSEGKTVTAVNMAISLTQTGARVALVDADMRKPRIHSIFALGATPGLSAALTGSIGLKEVLHEVSVPNLFVLPCGVIPPNPAELLMSKRFQQLLTALREYFDYVVIDSPPVSNVADARILGRMADATLVVVKAWSTPRSVAEHAIDSLINAQTHLAGVVLNDIDMRIKGYDSYQSGYSGQYYATNS
jgi:succinoglycan biosynthesis transport protein ExoP